MNRSIFDADRDRDLRSNFADRTASLLSDPQWQVCRAVRRIDQRKLFLKHAAIVELKFAEVLQIKLWPLGLATEISEGKVLFPAQLK